MTFVTGIGRTAPSERRRGCGARDPARAGRDGAVVPGGGAEVARPRPEVRRPRQAVEGRVAAGGPGEDRALEAHLEAGGVIRGVGDLGPEDDHLAGAAGDG